MCLHPHSVRLEQSSDSEDDGDQSPGVASLDFPLDPLDPVGSIPPRMDSRGPGLGAAGRLKTQTDSKVWADRRTVVYAF